MAGHSSHWLLRIYVFLMLASPLSPSTQPKGNTGNMPQLLKDIKQQQQQDMACETTPLRVVVASSLASFILELLLKEIVLRWCLGRRPQRRREEVREVCQAGGMGAGARRKQGPSWCQARHESPHGGEKLGTS